LIDSNTRVPLKRGFFKSKPWPARRLGSVSATGRGLVRFKLTKAKPDNTLRDASMLRFSFAGGALLPVWRI